MVASVAPITAAVFDQRIFHGDGRGVLRVTLEDQTGSLPNVSLWISEMVALSLKYDRLEALWSECEDAAGQEAGRPLGIPARNPKPKPASIAVGVAAGGFPEGHQRAGRATDEVAFAAQGLAAQGRHGRGAVRGSAVIPGGVGVDDYIVKCAAFVWVCCYHGDDRVAYRASLRCFFPIESPCSRARSCQGPRGRRSCQVTI